MTHCSSIGFTASGSQPVIQPQTGDVLKIPRIVCHQREVMYQGDRANHEIHRADVDARAAASASVPIPKRVSSKGSTCTSRSKS